MNSSMYVIVYPALHHTHTHSCIKHPNFPLPFSLSLGVGVSLLQHTFLLLYLSPSLTFCFHICCFYFYIYTLYSILPPNKHMHTLSLPFLLSFLPPSHTHTHKHTMPCAQDIWHLSCDATPLRRLIWRAASGSRSAAALGIDTHPTHVCVCVRVFVLSVYTWIWAYIFTLMKSCAASVVEQRLWVLIYILHMCACVY